MDEDTKRDLQSLIDTFVDPDLRFKAFADLELFIDSLLKISHLKGKNEAIQEINERLTEALAEMKRSCHWKRLKEEKIYRRGT